MADAELEIIYIEDKKFSLVARQTLIHPVNGSLHRVNYSVETNHPLGGFTVDPEDLAPAILLGFPVIQTLLTGKKHFAINGFLPAPTSFELTDYLESVVVNNVTIAVHHQHGFDDEHGEKGIGYSLSIRRGRDKESFPLPVEAITEAVKNSEMIFGHAFDYVPNAAKLVSEWLSTAPTVLAAYVSDIEKAELESLMSQGKVLSKKKKKSF